MDQYGRSVFNDLLFRRRECVFFAFDLLFLDGDDLRNVPLVERKARLKKLLRRKRSRVLYVDHVEFRGQKFFQKVCELDLEGNRCEAEGLVLSSTEKPLRDWIKIKNPQYCQAEGRYELFDRASD